MQEEYEAALNSSGLKKASDGLRVSRLDGLQDGLQTVHKKASRRSLDGHRLGLQTVHKKASRRPPSGPQIRRSLDGPQEGLQAVSRRLLSGSAILRKIKEFK